MGTLWIILLGVVCWVLIGWSLAALLIYLQWQKGEDLPLDLAIRRILMSAAFGPVMYLLVAYVLIVEYIESNSHKIILKGSKAAKVEKTLRSE